MIITESQKRQKLLSNQYVNHYYGINYLPLISDYYNCVEKVEKEAIYIYVAI